MPVTITYVEALRAFKSEVNNKLPPTLSATTPTRCHIQEVSRRRVHFVRGGRGRGGVTGRGYQGGKGRVNRGASPYKTPPYIKFITLQNGKNIEYHASFNFPIPILFQMKQHNIDMLTKERQEYKDRRIQVGSKRTIQQFQQENDELRSAAGS